MELKIEPSSELTLKIGGKRIGKLEGLYIDITGATSFLGVPKIKLKLTVDAKAFEGDTKMLSALCDRVQKYKFLEMTVMK
jgi:hypothetical protein